MNLDLILIFVFYGILLIYFLKNRDKFEIQNKVFALYKTKLGLKFMDDIAKRHPKFLKYFGYVGIFFGYIGMVFIFYFLIQGTYQLLFVEGARPSVAPVLPGVKIKGLPVLSFWHWIIAILFIATIHEFWHGVYARLAGIKIKSSGFAFLGPILAAFVEPDEKQLSKKSAAQQLSVLSAGPFINIVSGILIFLISLLIVNPFANTLIDREGIEIIDLQEGFPADNAGINIGEEIISINNVVVNNINNFTEQLNNILPGEKINIQTNNSNYTLVTSVHPNDENEGYLGIIVTAKNIEIREDVKERYGNFFPNFFLWFTRLLFWLYAISIGVGLFNLLPLGPVDGGRMFLVGLNKFIKDEKITKKIFTLTSFIVLLLIFINLLPYIIDLINFLIQPILLFLV